ncbi:hypothetical protein FA95DRAFT_1594211 [Auriscalpium vulgare]|uniref:Uncharacterized protein n=1 Tax=Auriscalpium vulgare TaxID=40419 RepID=A0ACB8S1C6_9AGAM|nr:hypothetical protein FA95DRAFT_1594211 [Auriscalpium vulgare]
MPPKQRAAALKTAPRSSRTRKTEERPAAPRARNQRNGSARPKAGARQRNSKAVAASSSDSAPEDDDDAFVLKSDGDDAEEEEQELDSDALDDDDEAAKKKKTSRKRSQGRSPQKDTPARKRRRKGEEGEEDEDFSAVDLKEGQEVVGRVVQAPKSGRVPPGQISQNTFDFLAELRKPECNDREWFKLHEPVFRLAETEWKDFVDKFTDAITAVDPQVPPLPSKDVIYRIYRDVRFSHDKTPYKPNMSATFSRSGRKGIFAGFQPGGQSLVAAGSWCPGKNELATIRSHIQHDSRRLRRIISAPRFIKYFGEPKKGKRQNIFGRDDELKVAPKGIDKDHKDIDLLKCRSFVVAHQFRDDEVLQPDFIDTVCDVVRAMRPLVHCLNDYMTVGVGEDEPGSDEEGPEGDEEDGDEED